MATSTKILLTPEETGTVKFQPQTLETATKTSQLLQENHDNYHCFYGEYRFHNHIVHHLLTFYGLGAPYSVIEQRYKENVHNKRSFRSEDRRELVDMSSSENFKKYLRNEKYYYSYLIFWEKEIEEKGWEGVLNEFLFAGDERADDLLGRLYGGFLHPLIQLGFGIEFNQPAIIAEALAQTCLHDNWTGKFFLATEKAASLSKPHSPTETKTLPELLDDIRADDKLSTAAQWTDDNKVHDGIIGRASQEMIKYVMFTDSLSVFNAQSWLSTANKVRLLQWKGYLDLVMYASRRSPPLLMSEITDYVPIAKSSASKPEAEWEDIFGKLFKFEDDGHALKLGRAVRNGQLICGKWEGKGKKWVKVRGEMWEKVGNMVIDSVEDTGAHWARSVGFKEAWEGYTVRKKGEI